MFSALDATAVFSGCVVILVMLLVLCLYLLVRNYAVGKQAKRKAQYVERAQPLLVDLLSADDADADNSDVADNSDGDGRELDKELDKELGFEKKEQRDWAIELFLELFNRYQDGASRRRVTELAEEACTKHVNQLLHSRRAPLRQYGLVIVYQLRMTTLDWTVARLNPATELEYFLQKAILAGTDWAQPVGAVAKGKAAALEAKYPQSNIGDIILAQPFHDRTLAKPQASIQAGDQAGDHTDTQTKGIERS